MKIGMVTDWFPPRKGGVETVVYRLSKELASRDGIEVEVITGSYPDTLSFHDSIKNMNGLKVRKLSGIVLPEFLENAYLHPEMPFKLKSLFKKEDYDVIHTHPLFTPLSAVSLGVAKQMHPSRKCVVRSNHTYKERGLDLIRKILYRFSVKPAELDRVIVPTKTAADFEKKQGVTPEEIKIVPWGADTKDFNPKKYSEELREELGIGTSAFVLFVGRLVKRKGLKYLLKAFQLALKEADIKLIILGEGPQKKEMKNLSKSLGINEKVEFVGEKLEPELQRFYASCDFVVAPSIGEEAFGLVIPEAMASGKPIIAGSIEAYSEVFVEDTGFLVPPRDISLLKEKIVQLADDEQLRRKMGERGRKEAVERYSWEKTADRTLEVYNEVLS